jgi:hypothetical protein
LVPNKADLWVGSLTVWCSSEPLGIMIAIADADQSTYRGFGPEIG